MNLCYGNIIGEKIGKVLEVDVDDDDTRWGEFLRIQVEVNLFKPLTRGRAMEYNGKKLQIPMKYEKLPRFYFHYGRIAHITKCNPTGAKKDQEQFDTWLRVESFQKGFSDWSPWTRKITDTQLVARHGVNHEKGVQFDEAKGKERPIEAFFPTHERTQSYTNLEKIEKREQDGDLGLTLNVGPDFVGEKMSLMEEPNSKKANEIGPLWFAGPHIQEDQAALNMVEPENLSSSPQKPRQHIEV